MANNLFGPEIGFDARLPFGSYFNFQIATKGGWVANAARKEFSLTRGDGVVYESYTRTRLAGSGILEGNVGVGFQPHPRFEIRSGYEYLWLLGVGSASTNLSSDLGRVSGPGTGGNILYHGWYAGAQVNF
jgi:hypothetical protein